MSHEKRRSVPSFSSLLGRFHHKVATLKPSNVVLTAAILAFVIFLLGGGLYSIIMKPYPAVYYGGRFLFIYPQLSEQFISDSIIATTLYAIGTVGVLMMYQSTKYAYKPRQAYLMFMIGAAFLLMAYVSLEAILHYWKGV